MRNIKYIFLSVAIVAITACSQASQTNDSSLNAYSTDSSAQGDQVTQITDTNENTTNQELTMPEDTSRTEAVITTSMGVMKFELYPEKTPETYLNFVSLADDGKYNGVIFHRVINDFMIQTGDFENGNGTGGHSYKGPGTTFGDEISDLKHEFGSLSMANRGPATNGSQFFIVEAEGGTPWLDGKHTVFGKIIDGEDVLRKIAEVETLAGDKPAQDITIQSIVIQ